MNSNFLTKPFRSSFGGGQAPFVLPSIVLEIEPDFVMGARIEASARSLRRVGLRELAPQTLNALPIEPNISNVNDLRLALRGVADVIGNGTGKLGLLLPDGAVRVMILTFDALPDDAEEAETLLRWRMKENVSYPLEEAKLSYQILWRDPGSVGLMVVAAKASLLTKYEGVLGLRDGGPELILPATLALLPLLPDSETEGQLLVSVCSGWVTTVVIKGKRLRAWRTKALGRPKPEDLIAAVASEVTRVLASCRDHLQIEVDKLWLCARPPATPEMFSELGRAVSREFECVLPSVALGTALSAPEKSLLASVGAPIAGLLANV